ncbi:MAG: hypothetical protein CME31_20385 [Gimesia sp.]|nr:hypothetical protein [Gimesia sp.]
MDWIAGLLELIGSWLIGYKRKGGFITNIIANLLWIVAAIQFKMYGLLLVVIPGITINLRNYILWTKDEGINKT